MASRADFEDQLDRIRVEMNERMKDLSVCDVVDALNRQGREIAEQHGIVVTKAVHTAQ